MDQPIRWLPGLGYRPVEHVTLRDQYGERPAWIVGDDRPLEGKVPPGWNMTALPVIPWSGIDTPIMSLVKGPLVPVYGLSLVPGGGVPPVSTPLVPGTPDTPGTVIVIPPTDELTPVPLGGADGFMLAGVLAFGLLRRAKKIPRRSGGKCAGS